VLIGKTRERGCSLRVMGLARARQAVCGEVHPRAGLRPPRPVPRALAGRAPARHLRGRRQGDRTGHLVRARRPAPDRQAPDCQAPAFVPMLAVGPLMDSAVRACRVGQPVERCRCCTHLEHQRTDARASCAPGASSLCSTLSAQLVWPARSQHSGPSRRRPWAC